MINIHRKASKNEQNRKINLNLNTWLSCSFFIRRFFFYYCLWLKSRWLFLNSFERAAGEWEERKIMCSNPFKRIQTVNHESYDKRFFNFGPFSFRRAIFLPGMNMTAQTHNYAYLRSSRTIFLFFVDPK